MGKGPGEGLPSSSSSAPSLPPIPTPSMPTSSVEDEGKQKNEVAGALAGVGRTLSRVLTRAVLGVGRGSIAGTLSGMAEETAGYPLDLVKTRMQAHGDHPTGAMGILRETLQKEGVRGLFKGLGPPFLASSITTATIFGSYAHAVDFLHERYGSRGEVRLAHVALAGAVAGFAQAFILCPVDVIKNRMQVGGFGHGGAAGPGNMEMVREVIATRGWRGLYLGMVPTLWRDVPGYAVFFASYEFLKRSFAALPFLRAAPGAAEGADDDPHGAGGLSPVAVILAGGVAGMAYHTATYPFDVVKTRIQIQSGSTPTYKSTLDCFRILYRQGGAGALFKGYVPTVLRSFPANAVGFLVYELTLRFLP